MQFKKRAIAGIEFIEQEKHELLHFVICRDVGRDTDEILVFWNAATAERIAGAKAMQGSTVRIKRYTVLDQTPR